MKECYGHLSVEASSKCNISCIMCSLGNSIKSGGLMEMRVFEKALEAISEVKTMDFGYTGETLLNSSLPKMLKSAREVNPKAYIHVITNGMLLDKATAKSFIENQLGHVVFSIDAATENSYKNIRKGGDFNRVINNIRMLNELKEKEKSQFPGLASIYTANSVNIQELPAFVEMAAKLKISDISVNNVEAYTPEMRDKTLYLNKRFRQAFTYVKLAKEKAKEHRITIKFAEYMPKNPKSCKYIDPLINWEGDVIPCAALSYEREYYFFEEKKKYSKVSYGNIVEESFRQIWNKAEYKKFRDTVACGDFPSVCKHCMRKYGIICP
ncbi:MAG: radical SAM protein [Candidatus Omnitrophota bacterium]|nr:radical SAM protein [Candidatus Omnitrophota bacterium]